MLTQLLRRQSAAPGRTTTPPTSADAAPFAAAPTADLTEPTMNAPSSPPPIRLTSFSHGGGCGCKIAPGVLSEILKNSNRFPVPPQLLVGIETADDARHRARISHRPLPDCLALTLRSQTLWRADCAESL